MTPKQNVPVRIVERIDRLPETGGITLFWVTTLCFVPISAITLFVRDHAVWMQKLGPTFFGLTNFDATRIMLSSFSAGFSDSWETMLRALSVVHSARYHARLYELLVFKEGIKFQYPPTSLLPMDVLQRFGMADFSSLNGINTIVFVANAAALAWIMLILFNAKSPEAAETQSYHSPLIRIGIAAIVFAAAFVFYPLVMAKLLGQIQLWIDLLFTLAALSWLLNKRLTAGMLLGLACAIKPLGLLFWCRGATGQGALSVRPSAHIDIMAQR